LGLKFRVTFVYRELDADGHRILMDLRLPFGISVAENLDVSPISAVQSRVNYHCNFDFPRGLRGVLLRLVLSRERDKGPADSLIRLKRAAEGRWAESRAARV
jgi:hypothetical protein